MVAAHPPSVNAAARSPTKPIADARAREPGPAIVALVTLTMDVAIFQAWAIAVGGLSSLGAALIVLLLLNREAGPGSAFAFAGGYLCGYVTIGMLVVFVGAELIEGRQSDGPSLAGSIVVLVLGLLLLALALKRRRSPTSDEPLGFLAKLDDFRPPKALAMGVLIPALNVKNLAIFLPAAAVLAAAKLEPLTAALAVISTAVVFAGGLLLPLLIYLLVPGRAASWLGAMRRWIEANSSKVAAVILPIIACLLLIKGSRGLWLLYGP